MENPEAQLVEVTATGSDEPEAGAPEKVSPPKDGAKKKAARAKSDAQLQTAARRMADQALGALGRILDGDGQDSVRLSAAREVLDRGYGKSKARPLAGETRPVPPYTVVVQQVGQPVDARLEDFD